MWKYVFLILVAIAITCSATENDLTQNVERRYSSKHHHHHGLHHGLLHYWVFLAIKAKIVFLIGTFISLWMIAGKAFAFLYFIKNKENCKCHEKVVISEEPHFEHKYSNNLEFFPYTNPNKFSSIPYDKKYSTIRKPGFSNYHSTYNKYSRNMEDTILGNMDILSSIIKKIDLTELAFDAMNLKRKSCKKRFVCEADQNAKNNSILAFTLNLFSDVGLMEYRNMSATSMEDCRTLGPDCVID